ncbi:hypothetical protein GGX14DRAFT_656962 [Mycena pura]|uniref:Uncharacterized protein n=1 Tax=Mycena pura TaxID=153505 RepID=A0AAD7E1C2_9AGAR|nr:hypothetical protein GGX14DRAFT_656962 [Mycena pura]
MIGSRMLPSGELSSYSRPFSNLFLVCTSFLFVATHAQTGAIKVDDHKLVPPHVVQSHRCAPCASRRGAQIGVMTRRLQTLPRPRVPHRRASRRIWPVSSSVFEALQRPTSNEGYALHNKARPPPQRTASPVSALAQSRRPTPTHNPRRGPPRRRRRRAERRPRAESITAASTAVRRQTVSDSAMYHGARTEADRRVAADELRASKD